MSLSKDILRYLHYSLDRKCFQADFIDGGISDVALQAAAAMREADRGPALIIHGIMPRSGTVYIGELLRRHPDLFAYPYHLWEIPVLGLKEDIVRIQNKFFDAYRDNRYRMGEVDFLPIFGAGIIAYLHTGVPHDKRLLIKVPSVGYLCDFFNIFPQENLLVLIRDGRDLVHSTAKTWPQLIFPLVCLRWKRSADMVLKVHEHLLAGNHPGYMLARFEDALENPESFIRDVCGKFGLDEKHYPYDQIEEVPVIGSSTLQKRGKVAWKHVVRPKSFLPKDHWTGWSLWRKTIFKLIAGRSLIDLGYSQSNRW